MRISVFGLGYVGAVATACLASKGHRVLGVDVQPGKIDAINRGESPITEPGLDALVKTASETGMLSATKDSHAAIASTDVSIICVGTPSLASGALDLRHVEAVAQRIREALLSLAKPCHPIIFRSTMTPGSTRKLAASFFGDLIAENRTRVYFHPEFLREGTSVREYNEPSLSVVGVAEPGESVEQIAELLTPGTEVAPYETAELLKYACNAFHATKVTFANEIGRVGKSLGVDGAQVMELLCRDRLLNISSTYLRPGNPFGGSCLPKDVSALRIFSDTLGLSLPLIGSLMESNEAQMKHLEKLVEQREDQEVIILGLAFKAHTDDLRGSAMVALASRLAEKGRAVRVYDPWLKPDRLFGANERVAQTALPDLESMLTPNLGEALGDRGIVLAFSKCAGADELRRWVKPEHHVIDINGWPELRSLPSTYEGICW